MLYHLTAHSTAITALGKTRAKLEAALAESFQENHPTEDGKQQILQFCRQNAHKPQRKPRNAAGRVLQRPRGRLGQIGAPQLIAKPMAARPVRTIVRTILGS